MKILFKAFPDNSSRGYEMLQCNSVAYSLNPVADGDVDLPENSRTAIVDSARSIIARMINIQWSINQVSRGDICVEIGVDHGDGIDRLLKTDASKIIGVDPWLSVDWDPWFNSGQEHLDARADYVKNKFSGNDRVEIRREMSSSFFESLDPSFRADWWFIDGDHREEGAYLDICGAIDHSDPGALIIVDDVNLRLWGKPIQAAIARVVDKYGKNIKVSALNMSIATIHVVE